MTEITKEALIERGFVEMELGSMEFIGAHYAIRSNIGSRLTWVADVYDNSFANAYGCRTMEQIDQLISLFIA